MIKKHKFLEIHVSDEEYDTLVSIAAALALTPAQVVTQFVSDLIRGEEASDNGNAIAEEWFSELEENCSRCEPFVPWLAENEKLFEMVQHLESVFKTIRRVRHPGPIDDTGIYIMLNMSNQNFLRKYADLSVNPECVELYHEDWPGYTQDTLRNLQGHYTAIRKVYDRYASENEEHAPFEEAVTMVLCWWGHVYDGV